MYAHAILTGEVSLRTVIGGPERDGLSFKLRVSEWQIFRKIFNCTKTPIFLETAKVPTEVNISTIHQSCQHSCTLFRTRGARMLVHEQEIITEVLHHFLLSLLSSVP